MTMTMTTTTTRRPVPDVHEMEVVHRVFRRELGDLPTLVRGAPALDRARAATLAEHVRLLLDGLAMHHAGEDIVLWPLLRERAAPSTGLVETMVAQHARVDDRVAVVEAAVERWTSSAGADDREEVARALDVLAAVLVEHLDLEEREILPLVTRHLTVEEWKSLGDHGRDAMTRRQLPLMFGCILEDADRDERALMLADVPVPIRLLLRTFGARQYRRYITRVRRG